MNDGWISLLIVWLTVEGLQYLRKVPFPRRMNAPLLCVALAAGLSSAGYAPQGANYSIHFFLSALGAAAIGLVFYGGRLLTARLWKNDIVFHDIKATESVLSKYIILIIKISLSLTIMAVAVVLVKGVFEIYSIYDNRQKIADVKALENAVEVTAFRPVEGICPSGYPYAYYVKNNSERIVESVSFNVHIKKVGFSGVLNYIPNGYPEFRADKILNPGEGWGQCFDAKPSGYPYVTGRISDENIEITVVQKVVYFKN